MMLREAEAECLLIVGNNNCFGCIQHSNKSTLTKANQQHPNLDSGAKNDLGTETCIAQCPYTRK